MTEVVSTRHSRGQQPLLGSLVESIAGPCAHVILHLCTGLCVPVCTYHHSHVFLCMSVHGCHEYTCAHVCACMYLGLPVHEYVRMTQTGISTLKGASGHLPTTGLLFYVFIEHFRYSLHCT